MRNTGLGRFALPSPSEDAVSGGVLVFFSLHYIVASPRTVSCVAKIHLLARQIFSRRRSDLANLHPKFRLLFHSAYDVDLF